METDIVWNNFLPVMYTLPYLGKEFYPQKYAKANRKLNDSVRQIYKNTSNFFHLSSNRKEFEKHFTPPYNPWEQRFCLAPGGDFFKALKGGKASIVTGHIDTLTESGIRMKDGSFVEVRLIMPPIGRRKYFYKSFI